jgi:hypothetical protein
VDPVRNGSGSATASIGRHGLKLMSGRNQFCEWRSDKRLRASAPRYLRTGLELDAARTRLPGKPEK